MVTPAQIKEFLDSYCRTRWSVNHSWSVPELKNYDLESGDIAFTQTCSKCGSTKRVRATYGADGWTVRVGLRIKYSRDYASSSCCKDYKSMRLRRLLSEEGLSEEVLEKRRVAELKLKAEESRMKEKAQLEDQIRRNYELITRLNHERDPVSLARRNLAIYRLYRYCDKTPKEIAREIHGEESSIRRVIGETFKMLCVSDASCIFKDVFSGSKSR